jgi:hypothetical protein
MDGGPALHGQLENENHWSRTTPVVSTKTKKMLLA